MDKWMKFLIELLKHIFYVSIVIYLVYIGMMNISINKFRVGTLTLYIVLVVFSVFLIYKTNKIVNKAYEKSLVDAFLILFGAFLLYFFANVGLCTIMVFGNF